MRPALPLSSYGAVNGSPMYRLPEAKTEPLGSRASGCPVGAAQIAPSVWARLVGRKVLCQVPKGVTQAAGCRGRAHLCCPVPPSEILTL